MALPTKTTISTLQFSSDGSPWCLVTSKSGIDVDTLEYSLDGSPWWGIEEVTSGGNIKSFLGVSWANVKQVISIDEANIKSLLGVTN